MGLILKMMGVVKGKKKRRKRTNLRWEKALIHEILKKIEREIEIVLSSQLYYIDRRKSNPTLFL